MRKEQGKTNSERLQKGGVKVSDGLTWKLHKYVRPHKAAGPATLRRRVLGGPVRDHFIYGLFGEAIVHYATV